MGSTTTAAIARQSLNVNTHEVRSGSPGHRRGQRGANPFLVAVGQLGAVRSRSARTSVRRPPARFSERLIAT
jgi:hypothetical protein